VERRRREEVKWRWEIRKGEEVREERSESERKDKVRKGKEKKIH
jgi:hypothetical protein